MDLPDGLIMSQKEMKITSSYPNVQKVKNKTGNQAKINQSIHSFQEPVRMLLKALNFLISKNNQTQVSISHNYQIKFSKMKKKVKRNLKKKYKKGLQP